MHFYTIDNADFSTIYLALAYFTIENKLSLCLLISSVNVYFGKLLYLHSFDHFLSITKKPRKGSTVVTSK